MQWFIRIPLREAWKFGAWEEGEWVRDAAMAYADKKQERKQKQAI